MAHATHLTLLAAALCVARASAMAYAPMAAHAIYPGQDARSMHEAYAHYAPFPPGAPAADTAFSDASSHLFNGVCKRRGYKMPGTVDFKAACLKSGFRLPSKERSDSYCKTHGFKRLPTPPAPCSKTGLCGCRHRWCWQSCGKSVASLKKHRKGDWCWSSYIPGKDNWLKCKTDDDCSALITSCGSRCG